MKKILLLLPVILFFGCEIYIIEEPVPWDDRDAFVGTFSVNDYSETLDEHFAYQVVISKVCCNSNQVWIHNFYGVDIDVLAEVHGNRITVSRQFIGDYEVEGTGRLEYDQLTMTFVVRDHYYTPTLTDFVSSTSWRM